MVASGVDDVTGHTSYSNPRVSVLRESEFEKIVFVSL